MKKDENSNGEFKEILLVWSKEESRYIEIDAESPEGKIIMKKNLLVNLSRKKRKVKTREKRNTESKDISCDNGMICCAEMLIEYSASVKSWEEMNDEHFEEWLRKQDICYKCSPDR